MFILKYLIYSGIGIKVCVLISVASIILMLTMGLTKLRRLGVIKAYIADFEKIFWSGISLDQYYEQNKNNISHPLGMIFCAVMEEWNNSASVRTLISAKDGIKERMLNSAHKQKMSVMETVDKYIDALKHFAQLLPIIGVIGTVCGLIDVFYSIDLENGITLNDAKYGIGGSLVSISFALFGCAIAEVLHWFFAMRSTTISNQIDGFIIDLISIMSRNLDGAATSGASASSVAQQQALPKAEPQQEQVEKPAKKARPVDDDI